MNISAETLNTIAAILATFVGTLLFTFRSNREQRKAISVAATKIDESAARQEAAFALYEKTLTSALNVEKGINNEQRAEIASLKTDVANYKDALDSVLREVDTMRGEMRQMRSEIDTLKKDNSDKDKQLDALTKAVQERETMIGGQVQKLDRFERALAEKDAALIEAQATIGNLKQNEARTADELNQLRDRVRNLETQVAKLNAERDTLQHQLNTVTAERDAALRRIETLEAQIRALTPAPEALPLAERTAAVIADMRAEIRGAEAGATT